MGRCIIIEKLWGACISLGVGFICWAVNQIIKKLNEKAIRDEAIVEGVKHLCHDRIIVMHKFFRRQKYCDLLDKENAIGIHKTYKILGGNGVLESLVEEIKALPYGEDK